MPKLLPGLVLVFATAQATSALAAIEQVSGRISFLLVHEMGSRFGPKGDQIDVEVVIQLDTRKGMSFGFQLRAGPALPAHQGMLDLLRDAFNHDWPVTIDYDIQPGRKNGLLRARVRDCANYSNRFSIARNDDGLCVSVQGVCK